MGETSTLKKSFRPLYTKNPTLGALVAALAAACIGFSGVFVRFSEVGPISTGFFRFFFAIPVLWTWMMFDNAQVQNHVMPAKPKDYFFLLGAGIFFAFDIIAWNISVNMTTLLNATLLNNLTPLFVFFFAWFVLKEKPTIYMILGTFLGIIGSFVLISQNPNLQAQGANPYGDFVALSSAVFYAGYIVMMKKLRERFSAATVMAWCSLFTFYGLAAFLPFEQGTLMPQTPVGWIVLVGFALVVHVMGQGLLNYSMKHLTAGVASIMMMLGPVVAAGMGWLIFNEEVTLMQLLGASVILIGISVARQSQKDREKTMHKISKTSHA